METNLLTAMLQAQMNAQQYKPTAILSVRELAEVLREQDILPVFTMQSGTQVLMVNLMGHNDIITLGYAVEVGPGALSVGMLCLLKMALALE